MATEEEKRGQKVEIGRQRAGKQKGESEGCQRNPCKHSLAVHSLPSTLPEGPQGDWCLDKGKTGFPGMPQVRRLPWWAEQSAWHMGTWQWNTPPGRSRKGQVWESSMGQSTQCQPGAQNWPPGWETWAGDRSGCFGQHLVSCSTKKCVLKCTQETWDVPWHIWSVRKPSQP